MSDTPETDAFANQLRGLGTGYYEALDFARDLERKLALCRDVLRELISERNDAAQRAHAFLLATGRAEL